MKTGLGVLLSNPTRHLANARVGLVANPTTVTPELTHAADAMVQAGIELALLFGPEHGVRSTGQYMEVVEELPVDPSGVPVVSLYGTREESLTPTDAHLDRIDVLVFDIQDVGARYYTYAATMALCMRACARRGLPVVVLDRPNPIGGTQVEGGGLLPGLENFCGLYPVPQRHGMTVGELARLYKAAFAVNCPLTVVPCEGWRRDHYYDETGLPWVLPSPNMPTLDTALVYPGMCLLEATNLSEGRGTTRPFELLGTPWADGRVLAERLRACDLPGLAARPCAFTPTFEKFAGKLCQGVQLHVTDREAFLPYRTGLAVLWALRTLWPESFAWRSTPYEFRDSIPALDLLTGHPAVRQALDAGEPFDKVVAAAHFGTEVYAAHRDAALLYA